MSTMREAIQNPLDANDSGALTSAGVGLSELETFIVVAELNSFSLAAKKLHVAQSTVTGRVQKLESLLGVRLLNRTTRSVEVTEDGRRLAEHAQLALRDLRNLIGEFRERRGASRRRVVVAATQMVSAMVLPDLIRRYCERFPDVEISVLDMRLQEALESVVRGDCDMGVFALDGSHPKLRFTPLFEEPLVAVVPLGHDVARQDSIALTELARWPLLVLREYAEFLSPLAIEFTRQGLRFAPAVSAANLTTVLGMLDAGSGIALLPRAMAQHNAREGRAVIPLSGTSLARRFGVAVPRSSELTTAASSFIAFLHSAYAAPHEPSSWAPGS
jgi:DNA-binding transcriptional LysR family regulator